MKPERRKKIERLVTSINKKIEASKMIPGALWDRILKFGILSFCVLLFGCYMGISTKSANFTFWSIMISIFGFVRVGRLLWIAKRKDYDTVEGTVFEIKGRHSIGQVCRIGIEMENGQTTELLLDKHQAFQIGKKYRFYFNKKQNALSGVRKLDAMLDMDSFYGYEEIK